MSFDYLLLYSDAHISPDRLDDCDTVFNTIYEQWKALKDSGKNVCVVNGGDTFTRRGLIETSCLDLLNKHYSKWHQEGMQQAIIVGNHDQEDKAGSVHPMRAYSTFKDWRIVDEPCVWEGINFFPYIEGAKNFEKAVKSTPVGKMGMAITHCGFLGAKRNDDSIDSNGVPVEVMKEFKIVFSGHYHFRNNIKNIWYIGNPMQLSQSERNQEKGIIIYEIKKQKISFKEIKGTSKFYKINVYYEEGKERIEGYTKEISEKDNITIEAHGDQETCRRYDKTYYSEKFRVPSNSIKLQRTVREKHYSRLDIKSTDLVSLSDLTSKYFDFIDTELDRSILKKIATEEVVNDIHG